MEQALYSLPDGWKWLPFGDLIDLIQNGINGTQNDEKIGVPVSRIETLQNNNLDIKRIKHIEATDSDIKKYKYQDGDLIFSHINSFEKVGKIALYKNQIPNLIHGVNLLRIRLVTDVNPRFIYFYVQSPVFRRLLEPNIKRAINQASINQKNLSNILVPFCESSREQKRIVEKLDTLLTRIDTAIEHLQGSVILKSSLLQSALDGLFTAVTDRVTIESLAEVKGGKRLPKGEKLSDEETEHPYIRVADFTDRGTIYLSGIKYISKEIHEQIKRYVISKDDLYISIAGTIGKTGFVPPELDGANLTENAAKLVIKDKQQLDLSYLYLFTLTSDFSAQAGLATKTVAQPKLALTRLSKIEIPMCSLEEQKSLVSTIEALKSKIHDAEEVLLEKIEDLRKLKASILDSAFKGEL